jgi:hypothetical protein
MKLVFRRLTGCWFGPVAGLVGAAFIVYVPLVGGWSGCSGGYPYPCDPVRIVHHAVTLVPGTSIAPLFVVVSAVLALQLLAPDAKFLILVGAATIALWLATAYALYTYADPISVWFVRRGYIFDTGALASEIVAVMLPASLLPVAAGLLRLRGRPSAPAR